MHAEPTTPSSSRLRVGLVGAGAWARTAHLSALASRPDVEFDAVYDPDARRAADAAAEFGFARVASSLADLLESDADACIVASPAAAHAEQAVAALAAGRHVLLEKPMATSAADAWRIADAARSAEREVLVALGWNYSPVFEAARRLLDEQPIGALEHVVLHMASGTHALLSGQSDDSSGRPDLPAVRGTWTDPRLSGGGYGDAQLSHALGLLFGLVDDRVARADVTLRPGPVAGIELGLALSGTLQSGATLAVSGTSYRHPTRQHLDLRLYGSDGTIILDALADRVTRIDADGTEVVAPLAPGAGAYPGTAPALAFADLLLGRGAANRSDASVGARTTEVLDIVRSAA